MTKTVPKSSETAAEKKARQRAVKRAAGFVELSVWVAPEQVDSVRDFVASLPPPNPPADPNQGTLFKLDQ